MITSHLRYPFNKLRYWLLNKNGRQFAEDISKCILLKENANIWIEISLKYILVGPIDNKPSLAKAMVPCTLPETVLINVPDAIWRH